MIAPREMVVRDALNLSEGDRAQVVRELIDSVSPEAGALLDEAWAEELDRGTLKTVYFFSDSL